MRPAVERTNLITGATDGLGRALATELTAVGTTLLVHGSEARRRWRELSDRLRSVLTTT